jgi:putative effector of murein hydrolase
MIASAVAIVVTAAAYLMNARLYRRYARVWLSPLVLTPFLLCSALGMTGISIERYLDATRSLVWMIGPLTLGLAVPVFQQRSFIRQWWPVLAVGTVVSTTTAVVSAVLLAHAFALPEFIERSLVARSISLPFAFVVSDEVLGSRNLTALFVVASGVVGIILGDLLIIVLRLRSAQAQGATLGAIAQVAGVARAHEYGTPAGVMASLTMIFTGALTVAIAPLLVRIV